MEAAQLALLFLGTVWLCLGGSLLLTKKIFGCDVYGVGFGGGRAYGTFLVAVAGVLFSLATLGGGGPGLDFGAQAIALVVVAATVSAQVRKAPSTNAAGSTKIPRPVMVAEVAVAVAGLVLDSRWHKLVQ
eukprot:SAG31_NODE_4851_length_2905_cov_11.373169_3_plen_130_part_00